MEERDLVVLLRRFNTVVNGRSARQSLMLMHESGLTFPQIIVLYVLASQGAQSISRVAELTRLSPPAASQMIDRLVEAAYVSREEDPSDRRMRVVALRTKAKRFIEQLNHARQDEIAAALVKLTPSLRSRFTDVMADVVDHLEESHR